MKTIELNNGIIKEKSSHYEVTLINSPYKFVINYEKTYFIAKPIIKDEEMINILRINLPSDMLKIVVEKLKIDNLITKIYLMNIELCIRQELDKSVAYYQDEDDYSELFDYNPYTYNPIDYECYINDDSDIYDYDSDGRDYG